MLRQASPVCAVFAFALDMPPFRPRLKRRSPSAIRTKSDRDLSAGREYEVELDTRPERVPGTLLVPRQTRPPVVLMLHGAGSSRQRMSDSIGRSLLDRGVASLSVDLPMHGTREGDVR